MRGEETYWTDGTRAWVRREGADALLRPDVANLMVAFNLEVDAAGRRRASDVMADPAFFETYQPRITSSTLALAWVRPAGTRRTSPRAISATTCTSRPGSACAARPAAS